MSSSGSPRREELEERVAASGRSRAAGFWTVELAPSAMSSSLTEVDTALAGHLRAACSTFSGRAPATGLGPHLPLGFRAHLLLAHARQQVPVSICPHSRPEVAHFTFSSRLWRPGWVHLPLLLP